MGIKGSMLAWIVKRKRIGDEEMAIKKKWLSFLMVMGVLLLSACGGSTESKIIGSWKLVLGDNEASYLEISEERILTREQDEEPMTIEYILTETQDDNFMIEVVNPESGINEFVFEGFFENKNTIKLLTNSNNPDGNRQLVRVDSITEEMEKDEVISQEIEEEEQAKAEQEQEVVSKEAEKLQAEEDKKQKALAKEEALKMLEDERARASEEEQAAADEEEQKEVATAEAATQSAVQTNGSNGYLQKANILEEEIITEAKKLYAHDMESGFYGQYYSDWDDLLNEVWSELKSTMPQAEFENLKSDQNEWIKMKEQNFAEMPKERAYERAAGMDFLAFETKDRTYYLIENYLN